MVLILAPLSLINQFSVLIYLACTMMQTILDISVVGKGFLFVINCAVDKLPILKLAFIVLIPIHVGGALPM
jgi:hypothetical protein